MRFQEIINQNSDFYLDKQKSFIPKNDTKCTIYHG